MLARISKKLVEMHKLRDDNKCPFCGKDMSNPIFRDELSRREFEISGICQECQDDYFKGE